MVSTTTPTALLKGVVDLITAGTDVNGTPLAFARSSGPLALQPDGKLDRVFTVYPSSSRYEGGTRDREETRRRLAFTVELGHKMQPKGGPSNTSIWEALDDETRVVQALYNGRVTVKALLLDVGQVIYDRSEGYHITRIPVEVVYDLPLRGVS